MITAIVFLLLLAISNSFLIKRYVMLRERTSVQQLNFGGRFISEIDNLENLDPYLLKLSFEYLDSGTLRSSQEDIEEDLFSVMNALDVWRRSLLAGILPEVIQENIPAEGTFFLSRWPSDPLWQLVRDAFLKLSLPSLCVKHPELIPSVLKALLRLITDYKKQTKADSQSIDSISNDSDLSDSDIDLDIWSRYLSDEEEEVSLTNDNVIEIESEHDDKTSSTEVIARSLIRQFESAWSVPLDNLNSINELIGSSSCPSWVRQMSISDTTAPNLYGQYGYGLHDSLWRHTGFVVMKELQEKLQTMVELKELVNSLGRRPSIDG